MAVLTSAGRAAVFAEQEWHCLTSLPICLYTTSQDSPRMAVPAVRRLNPKSTNGRPRAADPEGTDFTASAVASPFHVPLATCCFGM